MYADDGQVLILGAGGHARVIAALLAHSGIPIRGVLDRNPPRGGETIGGTSVIGTFDDLPRQHNQGMRRVALAIGDNAERAAMYAHVRALGFEVVGLRHPTAVVETGACVAPDAVLCMGVLVAADARVGANVLLNSGSIVEHECVIGDHVHVSSGASLAGRVKVGRGTLVGARGCIREGLTIGEGAVVGAGAVVISDVGDLEVAVGVPARVRADLRSSWTVPG
jgi:UDP-perosamine 4-acetyltransferase